MNLLAFDSSTDTLSIQVQLESDAYVMNTNPAAYLTAFADFSHTLNVHLDSSTAGVNTTGLSGHNYATPTPVPEPATWALALAGGALVVGLRRRG